MPFGAGPRQCVAMRFANIQGKIGVARILQKYNLELAPETPVSTVLQVLYVASKGSFYHGICASTCKKACTQNLSIDSDFVFGFTCLIGSLSYSEEMHIHEF